MPAWWCVAFGMWIVLGGASCGGSRVPGEARDQRGALRFVTPHEGQAVSGDRLLLWVLQDGRAPDAVVWELSTDGERFVALAVDAGPDRGESSHTAVFDPTSAPFGPLWVRARYADRPGGSVQLVRRVRPPVPSCQLQPSIERDGDAGIITLDCRESRPGEGELASVEIDFGDGTAPVRAEQGFATHRYAAPGTYTLRFTARSSLGTVAHALRSLELGTTVASLLAAPPICGCESMSIGILGDSAVESPLPGDPVFRPRPLGPSSTSASYGFTITARLAQGSNPDACVEGQLLKRTSDSLGISHKRACSRGKRLSECRKDSDCDDGPTPGKCTAYPFAGTERGSDGYTKPYAAGGEGPKEHRAREILWYDAPGEYGVMRFQFKADYDFLAFVRGTGDQSCECNFRLHIESDSETGGTTPATKLTLVGGERCNVGPI